MPVGGGAHAAMDSTLVFGEGGDVETFDLGTDKCGIGKIAAGVPVDSGTSCSDPHDFELYASDSAFGSGDYDMSYPGEAALTDYGEGYCSVYFGSDKVVTPGKQSTLRYVTLIPSEQSWNDKRRTQGDGNSDNDEGSQDIYCLLYSAAGDKLQTPATK